MALYGVDLNDMEAAIFERRDSVARVTWNRWVDAQSPRTR